MIVKRIGMTQLQSDALTLRLVREIHEARKVPQGKLYHQAQSAAACARQAVAYRASEAGLDLNVMPLLRYYSLLNTLKTLLYLFDVDFPQSTSILQHGISVRRTKRAAYQWTWEAVTLHKDGIAQAFMALHDSEIELPSRLIMGDLLGQFPQMTATIHLFDKHFLHAYPLFDERADHCLVSRDIASNQGLTIAEWKQRYRDAAGGFVDGSGSHADSLGEDYVQKENMYGDGKAFTTQPPRNKSTKPAVHDFPEPTGLMRIQTPPMAHPWLGVYEGTRYLRDQQQFPIWLAHYGLLYTLSALCRYSPSEWSDIVLWQSDSDALLVREYFKIPPLQLYLDESEGWAPASCIRYGWHDG